MSLLKGLDALNPASETYLNIDELRPLVSHFRDKLHIKEAELEMELLKISFSKHKTLDDPTTALALM